MDVERVVLVALYIAVKVGEAREPEGDERVGREEEEAEGRVDDQGRQEGRAEDERLGSEEERDGTHAAFELEDAAHKGGREVLVRRLCQAAQASPCVHWGQIVPLVSSRLFGLKSFDGRLNMKPVISRVRSSVPYPRKGGESGRTQRLRWWW